MFDSLRTRLALSNLLLTLAGLVVVVFVFIQLFQQNTRDVKTRDLEAQAASVARQVEVLFRNGGNPTELRRDVNYASELLQKRIIIVNPSGQDIVDSAYVTPFYQGSWHRLDPQALKSGNPTVAVRSSQDLVTVQQPIHGTHRRDAGAVLLVARVTDVQLNTSTLLRVVFIALVTALVVWLIIGIFFAVSISRPLLRIKEATGRVARGDYDVRVPERGPGEIARLARSFNLMAAQVRQTNQVLKDFVANVSHDLRTPLTMISGFSEAMVDGTAQADEMKTSAEIIHGEAQKMQAMVDDLLQLTRLESGLFQLDRQPTAVRPFVESVLDRARRTGGSSTALVNDVPADLPLLDVDPIRLERVLTNLVNNAMQYTPDDGKIRVAARRVSSTEAEISVSDSGMGIPAADLPRIFERFYRADKSRERVQGHSGLGLSIVREIVEAHGGTVGVESTVGVGTTFRLILPVAVTPTSSGAGAPTRSRRRPAVAR